MRLGKGAGGTAIKQARGSIAKIAPPRVASAFPRPRLFRLLDRGRKQPVIWVSAPGGFGKTTLIASYLAARKLPGLWYQLDSGDGDPATFFSYLGLAGTRAAPSVRRPLPLLTPEYLPALPIFTRRYFEDLYARLRKPSVVVLDNYQEVPVESVVHEVIAIALAQLPAGISVVIASRARPPPAFARLQASGAIAYLGADVLAMSRGEALALARLRQDGAALSRATIEQLQVLTEGWAAGLTLMLERAARGHLPPADLAARPGEAVFAYFAREILEQLPAQTQDLLLRTAFLPRLSARTAEMVTGRAEAGRLLSDLARDNYFTTRHAAAEGPDQYRYHDLFREFLLTRACERFDAMTLASVRRAAAAALVAANEVTDAVPLLRDAGAWEELAALILEQAPLLLPRGQHQTLAAWVEAMPEGVREGSGWLLFWLGAARLPFDPDASRSQLVRAFALFRVSKDLAGLVLAWSAIVDTIVGGSDNLLHLGDWLVIAEQELVPHYPALPDGTIKNRFTNAMFGTRLWQHARHPDLAIWAERAFELLKGGNDSQERALAGMNLALYSWYGDAGRGEVLLGLLRPLASGAGATPFTRICCRVSEAVLLQHVHRLNEGLAAVEDGLACARENGVVVLNFFLYMLGAYCCLLREDADGAAAYLANAEPLFSPKRPIDRVHHQITSAWLALLQGDAPRARALAEEAVRVIELIGTPLQKSQSTVMFAQALRACGERAESVSMATRALEHSHQTPFDELSRMAHLALAEFAFADGDEEEGLANLRTALSISCRNRSVSSPYGMRGAMLGRLYVRALQAGIEVEHTLELVRTQRGILPTPPASVDDWPWRVRIATLGGLALCIDDHPLEFKGKVPHKPLELLKALVALGGRDVREQRLSELLWPDAEGDAAHSALKTTLSRLRHLIGEDAIVVQEARLGLNPRFCWVDTWALEGLLAQAPNLDPGTTESERLSDRMLDLYRGEFLGDDDIAGALPLRERLRAKMLHHLRERARHLEGRGLHAATISLLHRALEVDQLAEDLYRGLMRAHLALGQHAEVRAVCARCRNILQSVAGVAPSPETEALCRALHATGAGAVSGRS